MKDGSWLIIPVEVQARELAARLLVAALAANRGYEVLVGHDRVIRRLARFLPKGVLFDKSLGAAGDRRVRRYSKLGFTITAVDEESTGFFANPQLYLNTRLGEDTLERAARWFCICDHLRDEAIKRYPEFKDRFVTTGLPRADVWREQFHGLYEEDRRRISDTHGPYILFCSNFGTIIHSREGRFVENQTRKQQQADAGASAYQAQIREQGAQNLEEFIKVLPKIADWFPDRKVIIRPHPTEDRGFWRQIAEAHPRLQVHDDGIATPWILASDCLVHHGCTTGIEAELTGRPHIMYAPHPDYHHDSEVMKAFAPRVHDESGLRELLTEILGGNRSHSRSRESLEAYYASLNGPLVATRILDEIDSLEHGSAGGLSPILPLLRFAPRQLIAEYWPRSAQARAYSYQKWQGASLGEIRQKIAILSQAANLPVTPQVHEVYPQLFRVSQSTQ